MGMCNAADQAERPSCPSLTRITAVVAALLFSALASARALASNPACCDANGNCTLVGPADCTGTQPMPFVYTCSPNPCPGACCDLQSGTCIFVSDAQCDATYPSNAFALGLACSSIQCSGACCNTTTGVCTDIGQHGCSASGGLFLLGAMCTPDYCVTQGYAGACCNEETGDCMIVGSAAACAAPSHFSVGKTCAQVCPQGACCDPMGGCTVTGFAGCDAPSSFRPDLGTCTPDNPCPGACCDRQTGACTLLSADGCIAAVVDQHFFAGGVCDPNPCTVACCNATTGVCTQTGFATCDPADSQGFNGQTCTTEFCAANGFAGACCDSTTSQCRTTGPFGCTGATETYSSGVACDPNPCLGACCRDVDSTCDLRTESDCLGESITNTWTGGPCVPDGCPGACCVGDGTCLQVTPAGCAAPRIWMPGVCGINASLGACCRATGCTQTFSFQCTDGTWTQCVPCDPNPCPGACCATDGSCTDTLQAACASPNIWHQAPCSADPCVGACCFANGTCLEASDAFCDLLALHNFTLGGSCVPNPCTQPFACCSTVDGTCFQGDALANSCPTDYVKAVGNFRACDPVDPCVKHACCDRISGNCSFILPGECPDDGNHTIFAGQTCSPSPCTQGICCTDGTCTVTGDLGCAGSFTEQGQPVTCTIDSCPGACCNKFTGQCMLLTPEQCANFTGRGGSDPGDWVFKGGPCDADACPTVCCDRETGVCTVIPHVQCQSTGDITRLSDTCMPSPCPPIAKCKDFTFDASASCAPVAVTPSDIDGGSHSAPGSDCMPPGLTYEIEPEGPYPLGCTTVFLTVTDCNGSATCQATVCILGLDCNENGIHDLCECFWDNGQITPYPNGILSHIGGAIPGGNRAADDFYLTPCQVHRVCGFTGHTITNSLPGIRKARVDFFEDCDGVPVSTPFATCLNGTVLKSVPHPNKPGYDIVFWHFALCSNPATGTQDGLWLEGGKPYWVSLVQLTDGQGTDESYWATTRKWDPVIGSVPHKASGPHPGPPPITYAGVMWGPWAPIDECCIECVNMDFDLHGESCDIIWDNGKPITSAVVGAPSGSNPGATEFRAADQFVIPNCDERPLCLLEAWVWTNCPNPEFFLEVYTDNCGEPGAHIHFGGEPCRSLLRGGSFTDPIAMDTGFTSVLNGKTYRLFKVRREAVDEVVLQPGTYWLSAGAFDPSALNARSFFAQRAAPCDPCKAIRIAPALYRQGGPPHSNNFLLGANGTSEELKWIRFPADLAFRVAVLTLLVDKYAGDPGSGGGQPVGCAADFNRDGRSTVQDLFDFLSAYFTGCP